MNKELPADKFIAAAAALSGRDPGELDAQEAIYILQEYGRDKPQGGDLYRQITAAAADTLFSDPDKVREWREALDGISAKEIIDTGTLPFAMRRELAPFIIREAQRLYDELDESDPKRDQLKEIMSNEVMEPAPAVISVSNTVADAMHSAQGISMQELYKSFGLDAISPALSAVRTMIEGQQEAYRAVMETAIASTGVFEEITKNYRQLQGLLRQIAMVSPLVPLYEEITGDLAPYMEAEIKKPEYGGKTVKQLWDEAEAAGTDEYGYFPDDALIMRAYFAANKEWDRQQAIKAAQKAGRERRRERRKKAEESGAIMELQNGILPAFSQRALWDAFAPGRISKMGTLAPEMIDEQTGRIEKISLEQGDIVPLNAADISYKAFLLLNAILANSVENYREEFVQDGAISFYVKGVLDRLDVDPRIKNDMQLDFSRKTAGVLYLEKQFEPLQSYIGTTPDGSRYSVLNYYGYNVETDTMKIRTPYLYQLWEAAQGAYSERKKGKEQRIAEGKKPLKSDLKPLEVNMLFKGTAYKEDDATLEIATYITNVLLNAGRGAHKTEISFKKLISNCPRLREKLDELEKRPDTEKTKSGKRKNKTARYNVELRKIARAYSLIMNPEKCDALKCFAFTEFSPTKEKAGYKLPTIETQGGKTEIDRDNIKWGDMEFIPPTKSTLDGKIVIKWRRIDPKNE